MKEITKDSPELKNNPEYNTLFQTYSYRITFEPYRRNRLYEFYYEGSLRFSELPEIEFISIKKLSIKDIYELFKGTIGIKKIEGNFKE